jgi:2-methylisocitrate lyase-like PEP mutase family enzyme
MAAIQRTAAQALGAMTVSAQQLKAQTFRSLHVGGAPLVLFNIWDAGSAKAVVSSGARAIATGSWSVAAANGFADGERLPLDSAIENLARIAAATDLPVTVDLESGYGETADEVAHCVLRAIKAGAVGCNLEDSFPKDGSLREVHDQGARIAGARKAAGGLAFFINARTDVFLRKPAAAHDDAMVRAALDRAHVYVRAGADGLFIPGLIDDTLIKRLVRKSPLPVNVMVEQGTPPLCRLSELGVARVSHGPGPYLATMNMLSEAARLALRHTAGLTCRP